MNDYRWQVIRRPESPRRWVIQQPNGKLVGAVAGLDPREFLTHSVAMHVAQQLAREYYQGGSGVSIPTTPLHPRFPFIDPHRFQPAPFPDDPTEYPLLKEPQC